MYSVALLCLTSSVFLLSEQHCLSRRGPLTLANWANLRSYTRRVRYIYNLRWLPHLRKYLELLSNPPTTEPLFPNLRYLHCRYDEMTMPLLNLPLPTLTYLDVAFQNTKLFQASFKSFPKFSPNIRELSFHIENKSGRIEPSYICHWQNLRSVTAHSFPLDINDLVHLSRMPALIKLDFLLRHTFPDFESPLSFSNLQRLALNSNSLHPISWLLPHIRLPAITDFQVWIADCPSNAELASFLMGVLTSNAGHAVEKLRLDQGFFHEDHVRSQALLLNLKDLRPCMSFSNLREFWLNTECTVCLSDIDLLTLAHPHGPRWKIFE